MDRLSHEVTYQDFKGKNLQYRRSEGLEPEPGSIDLLLSDLKSFDIKEENIPWRGASGRQAVSPLSIMTWLNRIGQSTVTQEIMLEPLDRPAQGLARFGDLVLKTFNEADGDGSNPVDGYSMRYSDVYVGESGLEDANDGLLEGALHTEGWVTVPLTDIRSFYSLGCYIGRINTRLKSGEYDPLAVKPSTKQPFTLREVLMALFFGLPGNPVAFLKGSFRNDPPDNLEFEGEPLKPIIARLLNQAGLVPRLLPSNNYIVSRPLDTEIKQGVFYRKADTPFSGKRWPKAERKTVWLSNRPASVTVIGEKRIRRVWVPYVPIFQWKDRRYYRLKDAEKVADYPLDDINQDVLVGHEKQFQSAPGGRGYEHFETKAIFATWAYKGYAPASSFGPEVQADEFGVSVEAPSLSQEEMEQALYMPVQLCPLRVGEAKALHQKLPEKVQEGDPEGFVLTPPTVWSKQIAQDLFQDAKAIKTHYDKLVERYADEKKRMEDQRTVLEEAYIHVAEPLVQPMKSIKASGLPDEERLKYLNELEKGNSFLKLDALLQEAYTEFARRNPGASGGAGDDLISKVTPEDFAWISEQLKSYKKGQEAVQSQIDAIQKQIEAAQDSYNEFKAAHEKGGGVMAWVNVPYGIIPQSRYEFDDQTGIIRFAELSGVMDKAFVLDKDMAKIIGDGNVSVMFAYESDSNSPFDYTSVTLSVTKDGTIGVEKLCEPAPIATKAIKVPRMRLYEDEYGIPMNPGSVIAQAAGRATDELSMPLKVTGYTYVFSGLLEAVLERGIQTIQHVFDGQLASTTISVNSPNSRLCPLGPAKISGSQRADKTLADVREMLNSGKDAR